MVILELEEVVKSTVTGWRHVIATHAKPERFDSRGVCTAPENKEGRLHESQGGILGEYTTTSERGAKMCCEELQQMQKRSQQSIQRDTRKLSLPKNQEHHEGTD